MRVLDAAVPSDHRQAMLVVAPVIQGLELGLTAGCRS